MRRAKGGFSLNQAWAVLATIAVVVPVTITMAWYGWQSYVSQMDYALQAKRQANEMLRFKIVSEVGRLKSLFENKSDVFSLLVERAGDAVALNDIYILMNNALEREQAIHEIVLLSPGSKIIAAVGAQDEYADAFPPSEAALAEIATQWGFDVARDHPRVVIPLQGRNYIGSPGMYDGLTIFTMATPVGKKVNAVIVAKIDAAKLWEGGVPDQGIAIQKARDYMLDSRGVLIHDIPGSDYKAGDLMTHLSITQAALIEQDWRSDQSYIGTTKQLVFGTKTQIPLLGWTLVSEVIVAEIRQPIWESLLQIFAFSLLVIGLFVCGIVYMAKKTLAPIRSASQVIDRIAGGDLNLELKPSGIRELNKVAEGFNNMIRAQRRTENMLRKREQDLAITLNSIGDAVIATDIRGKITNMNPVAELLTGWKTENCIGLPLVDVVLFSDAKTKAPIDDPLKQVLQQGEAITLTNDIMLTARDGTAHHIANSAAPIVDDHGTIRGAVLVIGDVTEKYKLGQEVDKQLERFKELSNLALTLTGAPQDIFDTISELVARLIGVQVVCVSEIQGEEQHFLSIYANGELSSDPRGNSNLADTPCGVVVRDREIRIYDDVARLFPEAMVMQKYNAHAYCGCPALNSNGDVVAVIYLLHGETRCFSEDDQSLLRIFSQRIGLEIEHAQFLRQLRDQEAQILQSQKMEAVGQLTGGLAHDFNNLLAIIDGNLSLLEADIENGRQIPPEELRESVLASLSAGRRGAELTHRMLAFSRKQALQPEVLNINHIVEGMEDLLERTLGEDIEIGWHLATKGWRTLADASQLENVLLNLVLNARDAMPAGGKLTIETGEIVLEESYARARGDFVAGDYVMLAVSDNGIGMEAGVVERVFEPFYTTKELGKGTGLGLSMVYGFAQQSGGHVVIYSEPGKGTTVKIHLPRTARAYKALDEQDSKGSQMNGDETILIIEDDEEVRSVTKRILIRHGYTVLESENGLNALALFDKVSTIDLLLSDVVLPGGMSGPEIAQKVHQRNPGMKVLYMSGYTENSVIHHGQLEDGIDLISKPFTQKALGHKVREVLDA